MSTRISKIGYTTVLAVMAYALLQSPADQRSYGTVPALPTAQQGDNIRVVSTLLPNGFQQIVVVDTQIKTMACYHIEPAQGKIQLKSVRQLAWDLRMEHFNAESPLPSELRAVQP